MPEIKVQVRTYTVEFLCESCRHAALKKTGTILASLPEKIEYICPNCGVRTYLTESYPKMVTEEVWNDPLDSIKVAHCENGHTFLTLEGHPLTDGKPECIFCCMAARHEAE